MQSMCWLEFLSRFPNSRNKSKKQRKQKRKISQRRALIFFARASLDELLLDFENLVIRGLVYQSFQEHVRGQFAEELGVDFDQHAQFCIDALESKSDMLGLPGAES